MTYAAFEHAMMYVWAVYLLVLLVGLVWAAWVFAIDEPRKRRRIAARLAQVVPQRGTASRRTEHSPEP